MKSIILVALAVVAVAVAAPPVPSKDAQIVRSAFEQQPEGGYNFAFESDDGIQKQETGEVKEVLDEEKKPHNVVVVRGSYTYINADGIPESINYFADETGYHAEGDSIPKPVSRR